AGIAAILGGRPAVLLGYATKVRSLAREVGAAVRLLADEPAGYAGLAEAGTAVLGQDDAMAEARERLRARGAARGRALDARVDAARCARRQPPGVSGRGGRAPPRRRRRRPSWWRCGRHRRPAGGGQPAPGPPRPRTPPGRWPG